MERTIPACSTLCGMTVQPPDFPEYPNQLIYGSSWNSDWGNRVFIKKYSTDASPLYYWNDNNFRSLRYADMLLLYAETLNELNTTPPSKSH